MYACMYVCMYVELSTSLPTEKNSRSREKNSQFLWQEFLK